MLVRNWLSKLTTCLSPRARTRRRTSRSHAAVISDIQQLESRVLLSAVLTNPGSITYTENDGATAIADAITVTDGVSTTQASATITITNFVPGQDVLAFTNDGLTMGNIAVDSNVDGVLTLTSDGATATNAEWQAALQVVTYENTSDDPDTTQRLVDFVVNDGTDDSDPLTSTIDITATNDAPVLADIETDPLLYAPYAGATVITSTLSLVDVDSTDITGATVRIIERDHPVGDVLGFTDTANITGDFNTLTGTLTLTGTDTTANYEAALRSVTYVSSSPDVPVRTVSFQVTDGEDWSNIGTREIGGYAQLNGNTVNVYGTLQRDTIIVTDDGPLAFVVNGVSTEFVSGAVTAINIFGYSEKDLIQIDSLASGKVVQAFGGAGNDTLRVDSSVTSGILLNGGDGNDLLVGGSGNDVLIGGLGDDWLDGGDGNDRLEGGAGNDEYAFVVATGNQIDTVIELVGEGTDTLDFEAMTTSVTVNLTSDNLTATMAQRIVRVGLAGQSAHIENVFGGSANDQITGNDANNTLYGNGGNDLIKGGIGDDVLIGGAGSDYLIGEAGNDSLDGGDGYNTLVGGLGDDKYVFNPATVNQIDTIVELVGEGVDTLDFSALSAAVTVNLTSDSLTATMAHRIVRVGSAGQAANFEYATGGSGNDQLTGNAADNILRGNGGNDTITGGNGNDILLGGDGNDMLKGISGRNIMAGGKGADLLQGGTDEDILLAGVLKDESDSLLLELRTEWTEATSYEVRVNNLLPYATSTYIADDAGADYLTGAAGLDWFLANSVQDVLTDRALDELFTQINGWI